MNRWLFLLLQDMHYVKNESHCCGHCGKYSHSCVHCCALKATLTVLMGFPGASYLILLFSKMFHAKRNAHKQIPLSFSVAHSLFFLIDCTFSSFLLALLLFFLFFTVAYQKPTSFVITEVVTETKPTGEKCRQVTLHSVAWRALCFCSSRFLT